jgi:hypothetical protein
MKVKCQFPSQTVSLLAWLLTYTFVLFVIIYISKKYNILEFFTIIPTKSSAMPYTPIDKNTLFQPMPFTEPPNDFSKDYRAIMKDTTIEPYEEANPTVEYVSQTALRIAPYLHN